MQLELKTCRSSRRGSLELGSTLLRALIILLLILVVYLVFFKKLDQSGAQLTSGITSNLTDYIES